MKNGIRKTIHLILETASGMPTCSERHGFGDSEFVPWQFSPVM